MVVVSTGVMEKKRHVIKVPKPAKERNSVLSVSDLGALTESSKNEERKRVKMDR